MSNDKPIKVLVVDDSAFMRNAITRMIEDASDIQLVGKATNGVEAIEMTKSLEPDVITLDIEMPQMDGLTALRMIKQVSKARVIMVSSLTTEGSNATLRALRYGASDFIAKEQSQVSLNVFGMTDSLIEKVRQLGREVDDAAPASGGQAAPTPAVPAADLPTHYRMIVIGSSTGGPPVLEEIARNIPEGFNVPIVVAQHMPPVFTAALADRMDHICAVPTVQIEHGMRLTEPGIYIAPGSKHTRVLNRGGIFRADVSEKPEELLYKPSVDELFRSASEAIGKDLFAVVLTGMGEDGKIGAGVVHDNGGHVMAQSAESCVVYGMPKAVVQSGLAEQIHDVQGIAKFIGSCKAKLAAGKVA